MCEYCDFDTYGKSLSADNDLVLSLVDDNNNYYLLADDFYFHTIIGIKYCPFCGRKLGGNNE